MASSILLIIFNISHIFYMVIFRWQAIRLLHSWCYCLDRLWNQNWFPERPQWYICTDGCKGVGRKIIFTLSYFSLYVYFLFTSYIFHFMTFLPECCNWWNTFEAYIMWSRFSHFSLTLVLHCRNKNVEHAVNFETILVQKQILKISQRMKKNPLFVGTYYHLLFNRPFKKLYFGVKF